MLYTLFIVVVLLICVLMTLVILSQQSKGGASGQFAGAGANQMVGAPQKMDILERITWTMISGVFVIVLLTQFVVSDPAQADNSNGNIKSAQQKKKSTPKSNKPAENKADEKKPVEKKADEKK